MYPVKQFLATIILAPLLFLMYEQIFLSSSDLGGVYIEWVILSFGFALPTYVVYHILYVQLRKQTIRPLLQKLILNVVAILGMIITIKILNGPGGSFFEPFILVYIFTVVMTSLMFNITENQ